MSVQTVPPLRLMTSVGAAVLLMAGLAGCGQAPNAATSSEPTPTSTDGRGWFDDVDTPKAAPCGVDKVEAGMTLVEWATVKETRGMAEHPSFVTDFADEIYRLTGESTDCPGEYELLMLLDKAASLEHQVKHRGVAPNHAYVAAAQAGNDWLHAYGFARAGTFEPR